MPAEPTPAAPALPAILESSPETLSEWLRSVGQPAFRARQIRQWLIQRKVTSFDSMSDLPAALRQQLQQHFRFCSFEIVNHQIASDRTEKLLLKLQDSELVECVLMREPDRRTVCISTQVGCAMGCVFCASGLLGVRRNLSAAEIVEQVLVLHRLLQPDERITNIVVMGIGEPLANFRSLTAALDLLTAEDGFGRGSRRITVSTVGLPEKSANLLAWVLSTISPFHSMLPTITCEHRSFLLIAISASVKSCLPQMTFISKPVAVYPGNMCCWPESTTSRSMLKNWRLCCRAELLTLT